MHSNSRSTKDKDGMTNSNPIIKHKRNAIALLVIAVVIATLMLLMKQSPPTKDVSETPGNISIKTEETTSTPKETTSTADRLASVAVIVLNNGKEIPIEIKVGDRHLKIPGPSSWSKDGDNGTATTESGRFIAGIIDTADVLKANGFKPNDTFSLIVGGTALNASNTFRVTGNHQPDLSQNNSDGYIEEYRTLPDEQGIWRSLKFKNIVVSYGQVPSLTDFLVTPQISTSKKPMLDQERTVNRPSTQQFYQNPSEMAADTIKAADEIQQYRDALNNPNPAIRAEAIKNLVLYSDQLPPDNTHPGPATYIDKALTDRDVIVREAALNTLDLWDGEIPMQMLSRLVLNDESAEIRLHALNSLTDRFGERSVPTLQQASHDPDSQVAQKAAQLLDEFSP